MSQLLHTHNYYGEPTSILINLGEESLQYTAQSHNQKTGNIPSQYIGETREESELTCTMCPLLKSNTCYAQDGSPQMGHAALIRVVKRGVDRSLNSALDNMARSAKYVRFGAIGDPGSIDPVIYDQHELAIRKVGLGVLCYTHQWYMPHAERLKGRALASVDTAEEMSVALQQGWRVAIHVDTGDVETFGEKIREKPKGKININDAAFKYQMCPEQVLNGYISCNQCGLCDGKKKRVPDVIVFEDHGQQMKFAKERMKKSQKA